MPAEIVDYFWSFRSHYCYLSIGRVKDIQQRYPIDIRLRPVLPMVVRNPGFFSSIPKTGPNRWAYIQRDTERIAERLGIPFGWPEPDPVRMNHDTYEASPEQPLITRLNRLALAADSQGHGLDFAAASSGLIFGGTKGWDSGSLLSDVLADAGLELDGLEQLAATQADSYDQQVIDNSDALLDAGHWGVPTLAFRNEPFFGQDRLEDFCWRLEQEGLKPV